MRHVGICAVVAVAVSACAGPEIHHYRVAVDASPLLALPASCYHGNAVPAERVEERNLFRALEWTLWQVNDDREFLEVESPAGGWPLGDAPAVEMNGAIVGSGDVFSAERIELTPQPSGDQTVTRTLRVVFVSRENPARGTIDLASSCAGCGGVALIECEARMTFTAYEELPVP